MRVPGNSLSGRVREKDTLPIGGPNPTIASSYPGLYTFWDDHLSGKMVWLLLFGPVRSGRCALNLHPSWYSPAAFPI